jgi:hypothetical protein
VGGPAPAPRPTRPRLHPACAGPRPMKWASEAGANAGVQDRRWWGVLQRHLTSCAVGFSPRRVFDLTHRAAIAPQRRDNAGARRVGRPAARCRVVVVGARGTPNHAVAFGSPPNAPCELGGQMLLGVASRRSSPKSLPFWQSPSCSLVPVPRSRRSRRARKSHFCRNTYVNGHFQKARVF